MIKQLQGVSDEEALDFLSMREITYINSKSGREEQDYVRGDCKNYPIIINTNRGRTIQFLSLSGFRWVALEAIVCVSKPKRKTK